MSRVIDGNSSTTIPRMENNGKPNGQTIPHIPKQSHRRNKCRHSLQSAATQIIYFDNMLQGFYWTRLNICAACLLVLEHKGGGNRKIIPMAWFSGELKALCPLVYEPTDLVHGSLIKVLIISYPDMIPAGLFNKYEEDEEGEEEEKDDIYRTSLIQLEEMDFKSLFCGKLCFSAGAGAVLE